MSTAFTDRPLAVDQAQLVLEGRSMTKRGGLLKSQTRSVPGKWDDQIPGLCEVDLVGHEGGDNNGVFCWSLIVSTVASG